MIKEFIAQWWMYHQNMEQYFKSIPKIHTLDYKDIVKALVENVLNCGVGEEWYKISTDIHVIDDSYWCEGVQIFFVHNDKKEPCVKDYFFADNYYGSCSGCDTLMHITKYKEEPATDEQVKQLMKLAFDMLRNFKPLVKGATYRDKPVHLTEEDVGWNG